MWDWSTFFHYLHSFYLIKGAGISLALSIGAMAIGLLFGTIAALMRRSGHRLLRGPASYYVWLFRRGTPVLVQLIIIYTGLRQLGLKLGVISSALIGLGVNEGAYLAEIIRAGISAVPRGRFEAARAIGMTRATTMRVVVMPQALRIIIPPLGNAFNGLMKTSSLASVISTEELLRRTEFSSRCSSRCWRSSSWPRFTTWCPLRCGASCTAAGGAFLPLGDDVGPLARAGVADRDTRPERSSAVA